MGSAQFVAYVMERAFVGGKGVGVFRQISKWGGRVGIVFVEKVMEERRSCR